MDAMQLLRDLRTIEEWLGAIEKPITQFKVTKKGGVEQTGYHVNINALLCQSQFEHNMIECMKIAQSGGINQFLGYLGIYILVVGLLGLVSAGVAFLYEKCYSSKSLEQMTEDNKDNIIKMVKKAKKPKTKKAYKFNKANVQPLNEKELHASFEKMFNINNENNVKNNKRNERSKANRIQAAEQVNITTKLGRKREYEII